MADFHAMTEYRLQQGFSSVGPMRGITVGGSNGFRVRLRPFFRCEMAVGATVVLSSQHQTGRRRNFAVCANAATAGRSSRFGRRCWHFA